MPQKHNTNRFNPRGSVDATALTGWTDDGAIVRLTTAADDVCIGAAAMVGNEKVRIVGALRIDDAVAGTDLSYVEITDGNNAPVSPAGTGRIRYNGATNRVEVSENGGAYVPVLTGGGWTDVGTIVQLTTITDTVAIGAVAMVGTEKVHIVGDFLEEGNIILGTATATVGDIRGGDNATIAALDGSSNNVRMVGMVGADLLIGGAPGGYTTPTTIYIDGGGGGTQIEGVHVFGPSAYNAYCNTIQFGAAQTTPTFKQAQHTSGAGVDMAFVAQQGAASNRGGGIAVVSGSEGLGGGGSGDVEVYCGTYTSGTRGTTYIGIDAGGTAANRTNQINLDAAGTIYNRISSNAVLAMNSTTVFHYVANITFTGTVASPLLSQADDATAGVTGDTFTIHAQDVTSAGAAPTGGKLEIRAGDGTAGNGIGGHMLIRAGQGTGTGTDGNVAIHADPANWQAMEAGIFIGDATTAPTGNPAAGGFLYSNAGALTWRGSGGTVTVMGPAEPHCPRCKRDAIVSWENQKEGWALTICMWCGSDVLSDAVIRRECA